MGQVRGTPHPDRRDPRRADRRCEGGPRARGAAGHARAHGPGSPRGRQPDEQPRDPRPAAHDAGGGARDHRQLAELDGGAAAPSPGSPPAPRRGGRGRRQGAAGGDDPRGSAHAAGDPVRRSDGTRTLRAGRLPPAGRHTPVAGSLSNSLRPGAVSPSRALRPRPLSRQAAGHVCVDPFRRRNPPLHRRYFRPHGDGRRAAGAARTHRVAEHRGARRAMGHPRHRPGRGTGRPRSCAPAHPRARATPQPA